MENFRFACQTVWGLEPAFSGRVTFMSPEHHLNAQQGPDSLQEPEALFPKVPPPGGQAPATIPNIKRETEACSQGGTARSMPPSEDRKWPDATS